MTTLIAIECPKCHANFFINGEDTHKINAEYVKNHGECCKCAGVKTGLVYDTVTCNKCGTCHRLYDFLSEKATTECMICGSNDVFITKDFKE